MNILFVSPHPDDETLGCGGTILKYKEEGHKIYWLNFTNVKQQYGFSREKVEKKNSEINEVSRLYNFDKFYNLELEPTNLGRYEKSYLIKEVSNIINQVQPNIIFLPFRNDVHSDHKAVFDIVFACTKSFRYPFVKKVYAMEIISETDFANSANGFIPNYFIDISRYLDKKIEIMKVYESELGNPPFPRSIENIKAIATFRGATAGVNFAEAFILIKGVEH
ncbi:LmbE family N-acetylglucosaminyl deacetylase [Clostridium punense]|uniref:LmbE family N-acetylglucosaminyl deacetylase n=2 Tax=Clostridium TaxID=1485 RepID=A0ABS4K213_9CLOT|nr:PIG-L family deacetylase [Clostridium punense]MBP2021813.1 LmbE family N-acetylglucosaminyl deacetylase [Clostridium punense]